MTVRRVAVVSVHTSPLDQPGTGDGGGLNVYVNEVARRFAAGGVAVEVFTRSSDPAQPPTVTVSPGYTIHHVAAGPPGTLPKDALPEYLSAFLLAVEGHHARLGRSRRFDLIHAHYWMSGWVGLHLRQRWGVPLVQSFHTLARVKEAARVPGDPPEPAMRVAVEERLTAHADRVVVPVCREARLLHRSYGASGARLAVVTPGVDLEVFHPGPPLPDVVEGGRYPTDLSPAEAPPGPGPLLLFVGRLQPLKGPDVAVRTLALVRREVPDARLLIVGGTSGNGAGRSGPGELAALARSLGVTDAVAFAPARPQAELARLYRAADLLLVPSRAESFGLVALEAQACGTPVVAADVGGLPAVVRGGGTLVPGHDPADHAAAALAYLGDPARRAVAAAAGVAEARAATWDRTVDQLRAVYTEVTTAPADAIQRTGA